MPLSIREMGPDDARAFLEVHHMAVRELATADYPTDVINAWAPLPITDKDVELVRLNADREYRLVAEFDGKIVGVGCLVPANSEVRACYVAPSATRKGVGSAILRAIERVARDRGVTTLQADSSLTAEPFYRFNGYEAYARGEHVLNTGARMACVKVRKDLTRPDLSAATPDDQNVIPGGVRSSAERR
jgi:putative acetyltransferase